VIARSPWFGPAWDETNCPVDRVPLGAGADFYPARPPARCPHAETGQHFRVCVCPVSAPDSKSRVLRGVRRAVRPINPHEQSACNPAAKSGDRRCDRSPLGTRLALTSAEGGAALRRTIQAQ